ncbi:MAG: protein kinase [Deltaproteobacteria bacterium]|nr:protein kinase [Deltaproteobacteria bacterium]
MPEKHTRKSATALVEALYTMKGGSPQGWADGHIETLIQIAAGYQFRETGVVEHLRRISAYVALLAEAMGWSELQVRLFQHASIFHDVGMVDVPASIVNKQGALGEDEKALMQKHTDLGRALLQESNTQLLEAASELAMCHHERFDGSGYPQGLSGMDIPMGSRILMVADVFDALTTDRPFKQAYPFVVAHEIVQAMSGSHFDPEVVEAVALRKEAFEKACASLASQGDLQHKGFRISARDETKGELFSIASEGYFSCPFCRELHPRTLDVCPPYEIQLTDIHKLSGLVVDDKYKLRGALGVGGMGTVYEARHLLIDRTLAIKFLDPSLAHDSETLTRFSNEARVFSTVGHPNLVEITDMGKTAEGIPYMVMEKLEGTDLARLMMEHGKLTPIAAVTIALEILRTLDAVHEKGIIHRDLKPENIFLIVVDGAVRVKLLDFGISRLISSSKKSRLTQKGIVFGTPQYMSPEQAQGKDSVDERSDVFTIGEILYETLTGREVFPGDNNLAILTAVTRCRVTPPRQIEPSIPPELEQVILTALERSQDKRFQSAAEFMQPLASFARADGRWKPGRILEVDQSRVLPPEPRS